MEAIDSLTAHYQPLLEGTYNCIDRIVLNAYCPMLMVAGGVRNWYRKMNGDDKDLSDAALMRYAGRFSKASSTILHKE